MSQFAVHSSQRIESHRFAAISNRTIRIATPNSVRFAVMSLLFFQMFRFFQIARWEKLGPLQNTKTAPQAK